MKNKDPAVLFYTSDFLSGVALMSMKERGQYITLLCLQRERGHMTIREMEKAAGKLSDEVKSKFVSDDDGKLFNPRMEKEIRKRDAHCRKQRDNIQKRWNKPNGGDGTPSGNTTVLPLGNGNGNGKDNISYLRDTVGDEAETTPPVSPPTGAAAAVLADYLNRVNPSASPSSLDELRGYAEELGEAVCKRAFDIALDNKSAKWPYIKAILQDKQSKGIKCLSDWDADEQSRRERGSTSSQKQSKKSGTVNWTEDDENEIWKYI